MFLFQTELLNLISRAEKKPNNNDKIIHDVEITGNIEENMDLDKGLDEKVVLVDEC